MNRNTARAAGVAVLTAVVASVSPAGAVATGTDAGWAPDPAISSPDPVIKWNLHATDALIVTARQPPQQAIPHLAMVHAAVYDAVNAIDGGREGYLLRSRLGRPGDSVEAAVATAAHAVLVDLVPAQAPVLDDLHAAALDAVPDGPEESRGIAVGDAAAAAVLAARTGDGRFGAPGFATGTAAGVWRPVLPAFVNDPNAWLGDVEPFLVPDAERFRSRGPARLTSTRYARELAEVQLLGSATSTERTADQTAAAQYWNDSPHGTWARIVRRIAEDQDLSTVDNARLFAQVYVASADTLITTWNDKARHLFWRPITAIREADTDGNRATTADPDWVPLIPTPPYPEHPSGLTSLTGAITTTLRDVLGTDAVGWTDTNPAGLTRSFDRLSEVQQEVIDARVWSGVHFRTADVEGDRVGRDVARWIARHHFRAARGHG